MILEEHIEPSNTTAYTMRNHINKELADDNRRLEAENESLHEELESYKTFINHMNGKNLYKSWMEREEKHGTQSSVFKRIYSMRTGFRI